MRILLLLPLLLLAGCFESRTEKELASLKERTEQLEKREQEQAKKEELAKKEEERNTAKKVESLEEKWTDENGVELKKTTTTESTVETRAATTSTTSTSDTSRSSQSSGRSNEKANEKSTSNTTTDLPWLVPLITLLLGGGAAGGVAKKLLGNVRGIAEEAVDGVQLLKQALPEQKDLINQVMSSALSKNSQGFVKAYKSKEWTG